MKAWKWLWAVTLMVIVAALVSRNVFVAAQDDEGEEEVECDQMPAETVALEEAYFYIEYNFSDGDLGVHALMDGDGFTVLCVYDPAGDLVLEVEPDGQLGELGISGFFFESVEPELDEFSYEALVAAFPAGDYTVQGIDIEGKGITGAALFSHDVPNPPTITAPALGAEEEDAADFVLPLADFTLTWEPVTETITGAPVTITGYEVIVTHDKYFDPNGFSQPIYDVHLPADRTALRVPVEFLQPDTLYEVEILALEVSGNQTISIGWFMTAAQ